MFPPGPDNPGHSLVLYGQQLLNYVQYFTWQFGRDWLPGIGRALAVLFGALGLLGARRHWRADRRAAVAMTTLILTLSVALVFYLNFKWGYSQAFGGPGLEHEVRERDYFFIASFAAWGVWGGRGAAPDLYRGRVWPRPTTPWMSRFYLGDPADTLPDYIPLAQPATGHLGPIAVALDPSRLGRPYLMRSDLAVLQIIKDQLGKRPI